MGQSSQPKPQAIVVVEDEPLLRMAALDLVENAGFAAVEARDAEEAIAILQTRTDIRVVLVDADMPGSMTGLKLAAAIRDRWPPIQMVITSSNAWLDDSTIPAHTVFYPKPYSESEVAATLKRLALG